MPYDSLSVPYFFFTFCKKYVIHLAVKCIQVNFSEVDSSCRFVQVRGAFITSLIESATVDTTQVTMSRVGLFSQASFQVSESHDCKNLTSVC